MSDEKTNPAEDETAEPATSIEETPSVETEPADAAELNSAPTEGNDAAFSAGESPVDPGEVTAELQKAKEQAIRAQAEMENIRRRSRNEVDELRKYAALPVIRDVLGPIDNLRLALDAAEKSGNVGELVKGIQMVLSQFDGIFGNHYAKPIDCEGQPFDPNHHEALQQIPSADHPPMTVLQEFQRGYTCTIA